MRKLSLALLVLATAPFAANSAHAQGEGGRPVPTTVGVGFGPQVGAATVITPTVGSVRLVLAPTFILEPRVRLQRRVETMEAGGTSVDTLKENLFEVAGQARIVLGSRGPVDIAALGGLRFTHIGQETPAPAGASNTVSTNQLAVEWGLGLSWYFAQVWSLSFDATNDLLAWSKSTREMVVGAATMSSSSSSLGFGLIWNPTVRLLLHLYF